MPPRLFPRRSLAVLVLAVVVAVVTGISAVLLGMDAPDWLLAQLAGTGIDADAAAVGGATTALGYGLLLGGAILLGLLLALRAGAVWARPAGAIIVAGIMASLLGSLGAAVASLVREPANATVYGLATAGIGLTLAAFGLVLWDIIRGTGAGH